MVRKCLMKRKHLKVVFSKVVITLLYCLEKVRLVCVCACVICMCKSSICMRFYESKMCCNVQNHVRRHYTITAKIIGMFLILY